MTDELWRARWAEGRIGFHEGRTNPFLAKYIQVFAGRDRILVPLCGKAEDLAFLASHGHRVVGVELVEDAIRSFLVEHGMPSTLERAGSFIEYSAGPIMLLAGDWFEVTREVLGDVDAVYDRAALIALPPELRPRYVAHLRSLVPAGAVILVITLEYPQDQMQGPPFAVHEAELRALYAGCVVDLLDEAPAGGRFKELGIAAVERCFAISVA
jgi:thiopurine S-methyltransferase